MSESEPSPQQIQNPQETTLQKTRTNLAYLLLGSRASTVPSSRRVRTALTTARYLIRYIIRRVLRYAKYAIIGAAVAAAAGTLGVFGGGLTFFAAPGILTGMGIGLLTGVIKFGWKHRGNHFRSDLSTMRSRAQAGHDGAEDEALDAEGEARRLDQEKSERRRDV
ncbi:hypothetical protein TREMEDRAFT_63631 [Tremella mesenterica DSM 1558]|uniref:uncharacterized protein n=1 Tax=Tremella mesenterica (strain ATCC 24925 / CBS 8224 / DSM 1558 / NBRC 9311 / NRRL Y-6157 / RJB 2259-6 / UBC 559-6) TaxID=578456 RepID=UPI0003F4A328|nr:uncharacterized protein TREMEDRAFT_63631 [Tremella mesenterica DSM 1558]EIW68463.1 hypothetical protein TREMEDRAFT_63631 [Tremella mesenterica DSM 1558]